MEQMMRLRSSVRLGHTETSVSLYPRHLESASSEEQSLLGVRGFAQVTPSKIKRKSHLLERVLVVLKILVAELVEPWCALKSLRNAFTCVSSAVLPFAMPMKAPSGLPITRERPSLWRSLPNSRLVRWDERFVWTTQLIDS